MKYGVIELKGCSQNQNNDSKAVVNIGDAFQIMAVKYLYQIMGIPKTEIISIDYWDMNNYKGEYVILPINLSAYINSKGQSFTDLSPYIIPVFIGISFKHIKIEQNQFEFFRKYEPIGCRDERTMQVLRDKGVDAYLAGCIACTLPKTSSSDTSKDKVFFADVPVSIEKYIPVELKDKAVCIAHEYFVDKEQIEKDPSSEQMALKIIQRYAEEARLVVTSRFHSACLCIALGIPVILAVENNYYKFSWLSKILPLYTPDNFDKINWNPQPAEFNEVKQKMANVAIKRIRDAYECRKYLELSEFFENKERSDDDALLYYHDACYHIGDKWKENAKVKYAFWGVTENAAKIHEYIKQKFPFANLVAAYDTYKEGEFNGIQIKIPTKEVMQHNSEDKIYIFVTSNSAADIAEELFNKIKMSPDNYFICRLNFLRNYDIS